MCKNLEGQLDLYNRATELLRIRGIQQHTVGYELLKRAVVFYNTLPIKMYIPERRVIQNKRMYWKRQNIVRLKRVWVPYIIDTEFINELKEGLLIRNDREIKGKMKEIGRDPAMQCMIETLKASGYIQEKHISAEVQVKEFIKEIAEQL